MSQVPICVSIDEAHLAQIQQISQRLQSSGMTVEQTLATIGVITGSINADRLENITQIEGVKNVETQQNYQLNPPHSDLQ